MPQMPKEVEAVEEDKQTFPDETAVSYATLQTW